MTDDVVALRTLILVLIDNKENGRIVAQMEQKVKVFEDDKRLLEEENARLHSKIKVTIICRYQKIDRRHTTS